MVCAPRLLSDPYPLKALANLPYHILLHDQMREDWQMCLEHASVTAAPSRRMGFSHSNMVFDAAIDGLGVALGRSIVVADDLAAGRLVKPLNLSLKAEFAIYLICTLTHVARPKVKAFRDWVFDEVTRDAARAAA